MLGDRACTACHKLGDRDGGIAPDLSYEGLIRDEQWLGDHFVNPRSRVPDSIMPAFRFPADDFQRLSAYLVSLKTPPPPADARTTFTNLCARCHGEKGDGNGKVAWYIDPSPRDFTKPGFMASKPRTRFIASIQEGVGGTSMPPWKRILKDEQIAGVLDYVMQNFAKEPFKELRTRNMPEKNPVASEPRIHRARRADFRTALQRMPRAQGGRQGPEFARHPAASAQFPQQLVCGESAGPAAVRIDSIRRPGNGHAVVDR